MGLYAKYGFFHMHRQLLAEPSASHRRGWKLVQYTHSRDCRCRHCLTAILQVMTDMIRWYLSTLGLRCWTDCWAQAVSSASQHHNLDSVGCCDTLRWISLHMKQFVVAQLLVYARFEVSVLV